MLKFRSSQGCEIYISDVGCLVIKQDSFDFGKEVTIILTPEQAFEVSQLVNVYYDEMIEEWDGGRISK
jgi:hypothetical protein